MAIEINNAMDEMRNGKGLNRNSKGYNVNIFEEYEHKRKDLKEFLLHEKNWFLYFAKKRVSDYVVLEENKQTMHDLLLYFLGIEGNLDLKKSIFLHGRFGAGKSLYFSILKDYFIRFRTSSLKYSRCPNGFITTSTEEIMIQGDLERLLKSNIGYNYIENDYGVSIRDPRNILINELGKDYETNNYGTDGKEGLDIFIKKRYDIFQDYNKLTHITSNFSKEEIAEFFAPEIVDRFNEMFNFVTLKGQSFRK